MSFALRAENLGKQYRLGETEPYKTLRESIMRAASAPYRWARRTREVNGDRRSRVWALRDVSFEISEGEVVGLIGRNGAGKTTLLKILAQITEPTEGIVQVRGVLSSLLEVGTGFHPELTGRENVYLNGAILGMRRSQIRRRFDEIVEFADVSRFIDTPVKRYSTGMQMRLAFAVAAHLESDVLLVDEILAVGDLEFQRKCMGRMEEASSTGRTVVFVSHSMPAISRLCPRTIMLDRGVVVHDGRTPEVIRTYLESGLGTTAARSYAFDDAPGSDRVRLKSVRVLDERGTVCEEIDITRAFRIEIQYWVREPIPAGGTFTIIQVVNEDGVVLFTSGDLTENAWREAEREAGTVTTACHIPANFLAEGHFFVSATTYSQKPNELHFVEHDAVAFHVIDSNRGDSVRGDLAFDWPGLVRPMLDWSVEVQPGS